MAPAGYGVSRSPAVLPAQATFNTSKMGELSAARLMFWTAGTCCLSMPCHCLLVDLPNEQRITAWSMHLLALNILS
jgi:hypothetical protein